MTPFGIMSLNFLTNSDYLLFGGKIAANIALGILGHKLIMRGYSILREKEEEVKEMEQIEQGEGVDGNYE